MSACDRTDCPLVAARKAGEQGGSDSEAHSLRVACVELMHKLGQARSRLRALGHDPDIAYHPAVAVSAAILVAAQQVYGMSWHLKDTVIPALSDLEVHGFDVTADANWTAPT